MSFAAKLEAIDKKMWLDDGINNDLDYLKLNFNNDFLFIPFTNKNINKIEMKSRKLFLN